MVPLSMLTRQETGLMIEISTEFYCIAIADTFIVIVINL